MNQAIKEHIEKIKRGVVPEGYKSSKSGIIPLSWDSIKLRKLASPIKEKVQNRKLEVLSITAGVGFVNQADKFGKEIAGAQYQNYTVLRKGDFSYNKGNSKTYPQGCIYMLEDRDEAAVPNVFNSFRFKPNIHTYFYKQLFINGFLNKQLYRYINAGVRNDGLLNLYDDDFYNCELPVPSLTEQQEIAEILSMWDKAISLKEKLIEEKKKQKKWLMQNLLNPDSGVRLPGFEGEWVKKSLKSLCTEIIDGDWIESKDQSDSGIRLIQTGNIGIGSFLDKFEKARYINEETFTRLHCTEVFNGDILISRLPDPIGRACIIKSLKERAITAVDCSIVRFKAKSVAEYFIQYACSDTYFKEIAVLSGGSTRTRISRKEIEKLTIPLPSDIKEQIAISKVLANADREIDLLEQELEQLQKQKKALMQLLLTGTVRVTV